MKRYEEIKGQIVTQLIPLVIDNSMLNLPNVVFVEFRCDKSLVMIVALCL